MSFLETLTDELFNQRGDGATNGAARLRLYDASLVWGASRHRRVATPSVIEALFAAPGEERSSIARRAVELAAWGRSSEVDDIHLASCTTPGTGVCATVVALAPLAPDAPAERALAAVAAGYEATTRCAGALGGAELLARGVWPSRAVAPIAAAVTGATVLNLDLATTVEAVALAAGSEIQGALREPAREISYAQAILAGVVAAVGAAHGLRGDAATLAAWGHLDGRDGDDRSSTDLSEPAVLSTAIKPFCGARQTLAATTALLDIIATSSLRSVDVRRVRVAVPPPHLAMVDRPRVVTRLDAITSAQYQVALALLRPEDLYDLERTPVVDEQISLLMRLVEVRAAPELMENFPREWGAVLEIDTDTGTLLGHARAAQNERDLSVTNLRTKGERLFARAGATTEDVAALEDLTQSFTVLRTLADPQYVERITR